MINILVASNNKHKINEIKNIFNDSNYCLHSLKDAGITSDPVESGSTFYENALIKAKAAKEFTKMTVIADDSGLIVPILKNELGVYSKRFAGINATDEENNQKLINMISSFDKKNRKAQFVTTICAFINNKPYEITGECHGLIITKPRGNNGFGYDPLFYVEKYQKTFAELSENEKNTISHRGIAIRKLKLILDKELL